MGRLTDDLEGLFQEAGALAAVAELGSQQAQQAQMLHGHPHHRACSINNDLPTPGAGALSRASSDDFIKLFGSGDFALDCLPDMLFVSSDGNELLGEAFGDLLPEELGGKGLALELAAQQAQQEEPPRSSKPGGGQQQDLQRIADTARSVLETLGTDAAAGPGLEAAASNDEHEELVELLNSPVEAADADPTAATWAAVAAPAPAPAPPPPSQAMHTVGTFCFDPHTGQILPFAPPPGFPAWSAPAVQLGPGGSQLAGLQGQQAVVSDPAGGQGAKRSKKPQPAPSEAPAARLARIAQGYSLDPATGRMLRHGPALNTAALQKDIPAIAAVFSSYSQHPFSAQAPPPGYTAQVQGHLRAITPAPLPPLPIGAVPVGSAPLAWAPWLQQAAGPAVRAVAPPLPPPTAVAPAPSLGPAAALRKVQMVVKQEPAASGSSPVTGQSWSPPPSTTPLPPSPLARGAQPAAAAVQARLEAPAPSGRQLLPETAHGFIKRLVVQEALQSNPPARPVPPAEEGQVAGLRGVSREPWSLGWDAYIQPVSPLAGSTLVAGFKQEAIFLGKFPTRDMAAKAHDLAALKLVGPSAQTNFPAAEYERVLPALSAASDDAVITAIRKDSDVSMHRTSKHKGVRRLGPNLFEARAEAEAHALAGPLAALSGSSSGPLSGGSSFVGYSG